MAIFSETRLLRTSEDRPATVPWTASMVEAPPHQRGFKDFRSWFAERINDLIRYNVLPLGGGSTLRRQAPTLRSEPQVELSSPYPAGQRLPPALARNQKETVCFTLATQWVAANAAL